MEKYTKNVITREFIEKELRFYNTADIRSALVMCVTILPLMGILTAVIVYFALKLDVVMWFKIAFSVFWGVISSSPVWILLLSVIISLNERRLLNHGDFDIVVCEVQYKYEKRVHRHMEKFFHFNKFKEISVANVVFDLASQGDEFYVVHYKKHKTVKQLYPLKLYEFKEM